MEPGQFELLSLSVGHKFNKNVLDASNLDFIDASH